MNPDDDQNQLSEEEIARRRDAALLKALSTPHKKQAEMKLKSNPANHTSRKGLGAKRGSKTIVPKPTE